MLPSDFHPASIKNLFILCSYNALYSLACKPFLFVSHEIADSEFRVSVASAAKQPPQCPSLPLSNIHAFSGQHCIGNGHKVIEFSKVRVRSDATGPYFEGSDRSIHPC